MLRIWAKISRVVNGLAFLSLWLNMQNFEKGHHFIQNFSIFKFEISTFERVPLKIIQIFQSLLFQILLKKDDFEWDEIQLSL